MAGMSRRRFVALVSGLSLVALGVLVGLVVVLVTQTPYGRDRVRDIVESRLKPAVHGRLYVGKISGGLLGGVTIDSLEIRDPDDSLVVASGPISIEYDPRDLIDKRVLLTSATLTRPIFYARRHENGDWNFRRAFPGDDKPTVPKVDRGFGDFIVANSVTIKDGSFILTMPWHPDDTLHGAKRDSAVRATVASKDHEVRRTREGYAKTWRWTGIDLASDYMRIADPDSVGQLYTAKSMSVRESDPPLLVHDTRAAARVRGDSIWINVPQFYLPGSRGHAVGKVVWGSNKPVRYAIDIAADTVAMADISWVYPTLPVDGGGHANVRIVNDPKNLNIIEYQLSHMDVRSTKSHLTGAMTFAVGGPVLAVKDLDVVATPMDFAFIRALNGKPFPVDWQGTITGTLKGRGGPLTNFKVDEANLVFRDAHVPGAETRATAKGELDILYPAFTVFHGLDVNVASGDLRTIQYLYPNFPKLKGTISGTARLDSSWLDVRFSNGDLYLRDGPDEPTHVMGSGRVTYGDVFMTYDLALDAKLLSLTQLARSYPTLPLRGIVSGPATVKGTTEALDVVTTLSGAAGTVAFNGRIDTYPPGYAVRGTTTLTHLDARTLLERADVPQTDLSARLETDVSGDSLANLAGRIAADLVGGSTVNGVRLFSGRARMDAANGKLRVDSLALESTAATVFASGGLGLAPGTRDSLRFAVFVDSLGGLRRWLAARTPGDTLDGSFSVSGTLTGSADALDARGTVTGVALRDGTSSATALRGTFALRDLTRQPHGDFIVGVDSALVGGVRLARVDGLLSLDDAAHGRVSVEARETTGQTGRASGAFAIRGDTVDARVDSLSFAADTGSAAARWHLTAPGTIVAAGGGLTVSPLRLESGSGGAIAVALSLPAAAPISGSLVVEKASIADFARLAQVHMPLGGLASLRAAFSGTREAPVIDWTALLQQPQATGVRLDRVEAQGRYADRLFNGTARFYRDRAATMTAAVALPIDLAFAPRDRRLLPTPLQGNVRADSADLAVLETLAPGLDVTAGRFTVAADLGGTWERPTLDGRIAVKGGAARLEALGVRVRGVEGSIVMRGDSIAIERFVAQSDDPGERGTLSLTGFVDLDRLHHAATADPNPTFSLTLVTRGFHAISQRRLGDLRVSSPGLHLDGSTKASTLTGVLVVDKGTIFIPELTRKRVIDLSDTATTDVGLGSNHPLFPDAPASLVAGLALQNVRIVIGPDVWLRSAEAAIQLGGEVNVTKGRGQRAASIGDAAPDQLALQGTLTANRGQYRLELSPAISRTFDVTSGRLTFAGEPDLNPALDISAVHTVRTDNGQDIRVRVAIRGTLLNPELSLSSDEGLQISQTDLVSYLAFGKPSFEVTGSQGVSYQNLGVGLLSASAGGLVAGAVQNSRFGSAIDVFSVQAGADPTLAPNQAQTVINRIANSRVTLGKQVNERTYIGLDAGICELVPNAGGGNHGGTTPTPSLATFRDRLGVTVNHRLAHGFSVSAGIEPSASQKQCDALIGAAAQITNAPKKQIGLDLSRSWTF